MAELFMIKDKVLFHFTFKYAFFHNQNFQFYLCVICILIYAMQRTLRNLLPQCQIHLANDEINMCKKNTHC